MLSTPAPLKGPRKNTIDSVEKQMDFHIAEIHRLKRVRNSHVAISQLPAELLWDVFLYVVETGLKKGGTGFTAGTFAFLRVCKRWNEIAIGFPQLWAWWIPGTLKAWHLFKSRSKDAPLILIWRSRFPKYAQNILADTETPRRIRQLDFNGTREQLKHILGALDSRSTSTTSSIRLECLRDGKNDNGKHLTRFFSLSFPKLSKLDINTSLPDPTSSILTTSNLTSLKLDPPYNDNRRYTQSQFLEVLQHHPNLEQLDLAAGGLPSVENSRGLVPVPLLHLVELRLCGTDGAINGFIDLVSMSSPLHNVIIEFKRNNIPSVAAHADTAKKFLTAYYGCKRLEHPRKATHLTISSPFQDGVFIDAKCCRSTFASHPIYNLNLRFFGMQSALAQKIIPLFPLEYVRGYTIDGLDLFTEDWCRALRRMRRLSYLVLDSVDIGPALNALDLGNEVTPDQPIAPKLKSLLFRNVNIYYGLHSKLLGILKERNTRGVGLKSLSINLCRVPTLECKKEFEGLLEHITWHNVTEMDSDYETGIEEADSEDGTGAEEEADSEDEIGAEEEAGPEDGTETEEEADPEDEY